MLHFCSLRPRGWSRYSFILQQDHIKTRHGGEGLGMRGPNAVCAYFEPIFAIGQAGEGSGFDLSRLLTSKLALMSDKPTWGEEGRDVLSTGAYSLI